MGYRSLAACAADLKKNGYLFEIPFETDPNLEMAEIHRRVFEYQGPALLFKKVKGSPFPALSNLYGTKERAHFLFRDSLESVKRITELKNNPQLFFKHPVRYAKAPFTALSALPKKQKWPSPVTQQTTTIDQLPQIKSWPMDGGAFVTLPQVLTLPPNGQSAMQSNIGMYRIQLSGNDYELNQEIGMHYQLHRGIGVHHKAYLQSEEPFRANIVVGGPPSFAFSAIMPLPEGLSEMTFSGMLNKRRYRYHLSDGYMISNDADFNIVGTIVKGKEKPEGPFGDHLGYYSLMHDFPYMLVDKVYHRPDAIWHFTVVGRPPAEDSYFGYLIHEIVSELSKEEFPGIHSINAVDESGVHPLLLAVGSERYMPFREERPEEILTIANHLLGKGQTSLAKYLWIANHYDDPSLSAQNKEAFFTHMLERVDWSRDLHFQTQTTIDTLDYSGDSWNAGSKLVVAACSQQPKRKLLKELPSGLSLPDPFNKIHLVHKGILAVSGPAFTEINQAQDEIGKLAEYVDQQVWLEESPLIIVCDDASFLAEDFSNFLWVTFTRSNPATDIYGVRSFVQHKHWGCSGPLIIDARTKPHHAPELVADPKVAQKVDQYFRKGGDLYKLKDKIY